MKVNDSHCQRDRWDSHALGLGGGIASPDDKRLAPDDERASMLRYGTGRGKWNGQACHIGRQSKLCAREGRADGAVLVGRWTFRSDGLAVLIELHDPHARRGAKNYLGWEITGGRNTGKSRGHVQNRDDEPDRQARQRCQSPISMSKPTSQGRSPNDPERMLDSFRTAK